MGELLSYLPSPLALFFLLQPSRRLVVDFFLIHDDDVDFLPANDPRG